MLPDYISRSRKNLDTALQERHRRQVRAVVRILQSTSYQPADQDARTYRLNKQTDMAEAILAAIDRA